MSVFIDDRAGSKDLIKYPPLDEIGELTRLESGDVCIVGNGASEDVLIGVEVKSLWDLLSSMATGRLQGKQVPAMLDTYYQSWLLYYGEYRPGSKDGRLQIRNGTGWKGFSIGTRAVPYGYLESLLFDLVTIGVRVKHVSSKKEAAVWIGCLSRWWGKPWNKHKGMRTFDNSRELSLMPGVDSDTLVRCRVAAQFPGLGFERAVAAGRYFKTISDMVNAGVKDWEEVPGIGKVLAKAIVRAVRG